MPLPMGANYTDAMFAGDSDTWGGPMNGVDMTAQAGVDIGGSSWHSRITIDLWTLIIIFAALSALWVMGAVVFRRVNIF
jgi:hypothetical protein